MQKNIISIVIAVMSFTAMAQEDRKVAVFEPVGSSGNTIKEIVREEISYVVVNTVGYSVLERHMINKVLEENRFQASGLVDDTQIVEMGRLMGANLAFVSNVTPLGLNYHISCKLIDVQTGRIEKQNTTQTQRGTGDLTDAVRKTVTEMLGVITRANIMPRPAEVPQNSTIVEEKSAQQPTQNTPSRTNSQRIPQSQSITDQMRNRTNQTIEDTRRQQYRR